MRERLSSRLGFILLSAGCAIGIGNVWRFPYICGMSGGGWFLLVYLLALAFLGVPILMMEIAVGRAAQRSLAVAHAVLTPERRLWRAHGVMGLIGNTLLMMFYTMVTGWMTIYFWKTAVGDFAGLDAVQIGDAFNAVLADPWVQGWNMLGVVLAGAAVCGIGLQKGLECISKWMMLALLLLIFGLAVNSLLLDGSAEGIRFFLVPSSERLLGIGVVKVVFNAVNQAFFTLSLGIGAMTIFGSYIDKKRALLGEAINISLLDTLVAVCSGLIIIPACFAYGVEVDQGPSVIFVTLPNVFNHMSGGRVWGALFFLFMSMAALTTVFAVFESIVANIMEYFAVSRRRAALLVALTMPVLSLPAILGFNILSGVHLLGGKSTILDFEDFIVSGLLLPLGALIFVFYCTRRYGWGWSRFLAEANAGEGLRLPFWLRGYCAYALPLIVLTIMVLGLVQRFR